MIRKAAGSDLPRIVSIYNQAINARCCTGDTTAFSVEERVPWFESHGEKTPIFVYESDCGVVAYGYISAYRAGRKAFESMGEISYYVDFAHHGRGIGSRLVEHLLREAGELGYTHLIAMLLNCNDKSVSLLEKHGFSCWGVLPNIARIGGKQYSHLYYGRNLCAQK
jgi:phosphinothricin acetyltransferase